MTSRLNPYIGFDGNARAAMEFYREAFGGELVLRTYGDFGHADPAAADRIMHAQLETPLGFTLMGADTPPGTPYPGMGAITISISGNDADELQAYWDALSANGTVTLPLQKQAWGDAFGMCIDAFGIAWMVNIAA